jgi:hypothetical protein
MSNNGQRMLSALLDLLIAVSANEQYTKMNVSALAYVFAPCILRPKKYETDVLVCTSPCHPSFFISLCSRFAESDG